ncbi:uncharacterized protein PG998_000348 [Apiospora kogelbergensis]|uniref:Uncharacterized protein n=1 Tax=Apiospora kogelbergensis TaxID=1337665 RepID=A0AAW0QXI3_9PEZI
MPGRTKLDLALTGAPVSINLSKMLVFFATSRSSRDEQCYCTEVQLSTGFCLPSLPPGPLGYTDPIILSELAPFRARVSAHIETLPD